LSGPIDLETRLAPLPLDTLATGHIADRGAHKPAVFGVNERQADLDREFFAVVAKTDRLETGPEFAYPQRRNVPAQIHRMLRPGPLSDEHADRTTEKVPAWIAEQSLRLSVDQYDDAGGVEDDHRVGCRLEELAIERIAMRHSKVERCHVMPRRNSDQVRAR
jgi:hypothetical protein